MYGVQAFHDLIEVLKADPTISLNVAVLDPALRQVMGGSQIQADTLFTNIAVVMHFTLYFSQQSANLIKTIFLPRLTDSPETSRAGCLGSKVKKTIAQ